MGEYAEMMLDGTVCESCGEWLGDDEGPGFPRVCPGCQQQDTPHEADVKPQSRKRSRSR